MESWWSVWELHGPTRGDLIDLLRAQPPHGTTLELVLATVGSSGFWPHVMAFWRADSFEAWLEAGADDAFDEKRIWLGEAKLYRTLAGALPARPALRVERVVADSREALAGIDGPAFLLEEALAPWQGLALWDAADLPSLAAREQDGIGARGPGIRQVTGWWALVPPEREMA